MKLAIADPPYPPNLLGAARGTGHGPGLRSTRYYAGGAKNSHRKHVADDHPGAKEWNSPARHRLLLEQLVDEFDGWAIATTSDAVAAGVYAPLPYGTKVMAWVKTNAQPTGNRIGTMWEAVLVLTPDGRRSRATAKRRVPDVLTAPAPGGGFAGGKPLAWTRWVLDALGFDPDQDTVADLFPGSGAVAAGIRNATEQRTLL